jgi:hypothetical protein
MKKIASVLAGVAASVAAFFVARALREDRQRDTSRADLDRDERNIACGHAAQGLRPPRPSPRQRQPRRRPWSRRRMQRLEATSHSPTWRPDRGTNRAWPAISAAA